jgi:hypothetical protein
MDCWHAENVANAPGQNQSESDAADGLNETPQWMT